MKKDKITKEQEKKYVKSQGSFCPYCDSTDLEGGSMNGDGNYIAMQVYCLNCKSKWQDIYTLTGILEE